MPITSRLWSEHSSAIAQFATWTALAEKNRASLQHYNPIIDEEVAANFPTTSTGSFALNWYWFD